MAENVNFLQPDNEQIRHQIRGILDSYNHEWDVLAELCQNSIDAITRGGPSRGHIKLNVDSVEKTITIEDNGTGIDPQQLFRLLRPFSSDKGNLSNQIGQKGVGISFVMFMSSRFELESRHADGNRSAVVENAASWLAQVSDEPLMLTLSEVGPAEGPPGVKIKLTLNDREHPIFQLSLDQLVFALRTRTALGNTNHIWGDPFNGDVELKHRDLGGAEQTLEFDCNYLLPTEGLSPHDWISFSSWDEWRLESDRSDSDKRRKLKDRVVVASGSDQRPGRTNRYWACLVPDRATWDTLSKNHRQLTESELQATDDEISENPYVFRGGLYVSTKGMPTGIKIDLPPRGSAGYMPNFFILIEDPSLNFDIGRKYIPGRLQGTLKEKAYAQFREYVNDIIKYVSGSAGDGNARWGRDEIFEEIAELADLDSPNSAFKKRPNSQEATVAGMFFEQLGKGGVPGLNPLVSGYKGRYDLYAKWLKRKIVLEFKYDLSGLMRDFSDERKMFDEIDILVVWEITERDRQELKRRGLGAEPLSSSSLSRAPDRFPLATAQLLLSGASPIQVVIMKSILCPEE